MHFWNNVHQVRLMPNHWKAKSFQSTADSRYLEFDGTMDKIRGNRSLTQEELRKYRKCSLFNDEREKLERNFEELKPASHVPILGTILNIFDVFVAVFSLPVKFRVLVHHVSFALLCVGRSILIIQNCLHYTKRERSLYATY